VAGAVVVVEPPVVPGVDVAPGAGVCVPGVESFTVPGEVGAGAVGVAVDGEPVVGDACPGVVVCGEVPMPDVLVVPLAPGLGVPGCEARAPAAAPAVCGANAAAISTGE
jgi:hypothetical protein